MGFFGFNFCLQSPSISSFFIFASSFWLFRFQLFTAKPERPKFFHFGCFWGLLRLRFLLVKPECIELFRFCVFFSACSASNFASKSRVIYLFFFLRLFFLLFRLRLSPVKAECHLLFHFCVFFWLLLSQILDEKPERASLFRLCVFGAFCVFFWLFGLRFLPVKPECPKLCVFFWLFASFFGFSRLCLALSAPSLAPFFGFPRPKPGFFFPYPFFSLLEFHFGWLYFFRVAQKITQTFIGSRCEQ